MSEATQTQSQTQPQESAVSDINQQFGNTELDLGDVEKSMQDIPPPIPEGDYLLRYALGDADPDKAIKLKKKEGVNGGRPYLVISLKGAVVESRNEDVATEEVHNRTFFSTITSIKGRSGASNYTDWLKSIGHADGAPGTFDEIKPWLTELLATGQAEGVAKIVWKASAKSSVPNPDGSTRYINNTPYSSMGKFPTDPETGKHLPVIEGYYNKETDETLDLVAREEVKVYYPAA